MAQKLIDRKEDLFPYGSSVVDFDVKALETIMMKEVIDETKKAKNIALKFLKEANPVPGATVRATGTGGGTTKKEAVQLSRFLSDEKGGQAFLKYPIWLKN